MRIRRSCARRHHPRHQRRQRIERTAIQWHFYDSGVIDDSSQFGYAVLQISDVAETVTLSVMFPISSLKSSRAFCATANVRSALVRVRNPDDPDLQIVGSRRKE